MKVTRLGWIGTKTQQFDAMNEFYRDVLGLEVLSIDDSSGRSSWKTAPKSMSTARRTHTTSSSAKVRW